MTAPESSKAIDKARDHIAREIATLLGIGGSDIHSTAREFWYQVAVASSVGIPADDLTAMAKQVFHAIDEDWDDDYEVDGGESLSIEAYETLYDVLKSRVASPDSFETTRPGDQDAGDDEDDSIGPVDLTFESRAETTQTDIDTTLNKIGKGSLILNPDWQRNFVWKLKKQRRLIESILLGLPIPSLLLFRSSETGKAYVIDGRQRLETISRFRAPKPERNQEKKRFKTFSSKIEGWRPNEKLSPAANKFYDELPENYKAKFDSTTLVLHTFVDLPSDKLYQIFRRYNTGAEQLKAAEIRNAVYQASPLHAMMYRIAGENGLDDTFTDSERECVETLASIMRNKRARYGAYDFVGRYFAFAYMSSGSVANATNDFMVKYESSSVDMLKEEFVASLIKTVEWYEYPLIAPSDSGKFHAFLATVQMVSTTRMIAHITRGTVSEDAVRRAVASKWPGFASQTLDQKQNSTAFWTRQRDWIVEIEEACGIVAQ